MKKVFLLMAVMFLTGSLCNAQKFNDLINLTRYAKANAELAPPVKGEHRVVIIGNSVTDNWARMRPDFFKNNNYIGRGISGQTSPQLLSRFRRDVINLKPQIVVIHIGTNDVAENTGTFDEQFTLENIESMAQLAQANKIKVVLTSVLPTALYPWRKTIENVPDKIAKLNADIEAYAKTHKCSYINFYESMLNPQTRGMKDGLSKDDVHPTDKGYEIMEELVIKTVNRIK